MNKSKMYSCLYEFVGTAGLVFGMNLSSIGNQDGSPFKKIDPINVGIVYFTMVTMLGSMTGGHFNPALTVGLLVKEGRSNLTNNLLSSFLIILA